jgi:UDPglucose 6-dehydrogenase
MKSNREEDSDSGGYAFKKDTNDTSESPAIDVVKKLIADTPSEIAIFDPHCSPEVVQNEIKRLYRSSGLEFLKPEGPIGIYNESYGTCADAGAVLILTDWHQFRYPCPTLPRSAFHDGNQESNLTGRRQGEPSKTKLLAQRERKQSGNNTRPEVNGFFGSTSAL